MWPWGHLAVGYLCYSAACRLTDRGGSGRAVVALAFGTQFPDLVDKPLAWTVHVLPNGRSLAHSVVVASVVAVALLALSWRLTPKPGGRVGTDGGQAGTDDRPSGARFGPGRFPLAGPFLVGYASHLLGDAAYPLVLGDVTTLAFLLWPVLPPVSYEGPKSFVGHVAAIEPTPFFLAQFALVAVAVVVWNDDGRPGLDAIGRAFGS